MQNGHSSHKTMDIRFLHHHLFSYKKNYHGTALHKLPPTYLLKNSGGASDGVNLSPRLMACVLAFCNVISLSFHKDQLRLIFCCFVNGILNLAPSLKFAMLAHLTPKVLPRAQIYELIFPSILFTEMESLTRKLQMSLSIGLKTQWPF